MTPAGDDEFKALSLRNVVIDWFKGQAVSTILLFAILWVVWTLIPQVIEQVNRGYSDNAKVLREISDLNRKQDEKIHYEVREGLREVRQILINNQFLIRELRQELIRSGHKSDIPLPPSIELEQQPGLDDNSIIPKPSTES